MGSCAYHACMLSCFDCIRLCATLWTIARQAPVHGTLEARLLQWVACPSPGDLPNPGTKPTSLTSLALAGEFFTISATWEATCSSYVNKDERCCTISPSCTSHISFLIFLSLEAHVDLLALSRASLHFRGDKVIERVNSQ